MYIKDVWAKAQTILIVLSRSRGKASKLPWQRPINLLYIFAYLVNIKTLGEKVTGRDLNRLYYKG
jgi:hypothetical protein